MDTITTTQDLLKCNGSAQPVMVALTPNETRLIASAPELLEILQAIKRHGELANVSAEPPHSYTGGKKPASKDVWQFPRHMLVDLDAAIAKATGDEVDDPVCQCVEPGCAVCDVDGDA